MSAWRKARKTEQRAAKAEGRNPRYIPTNSKPHKTAPANWQEAHGKGRLITLAKIEAAKRWIKQRFEQMRAAQEKKDAEAKERGMAVHQALESHYKDGPAPVPDAEVVTRDELGRGEPEVEVVRS